MNNSELIITIITIIFTVISSILGYFLKKNEKTKKYYETYQIIEAKIKELCVDAEKNYTKGDQKKKYVISNINQFLLDQKITIDVGTIDEIIESIIDVSNQINKPK